MKQLTQKLAEILEAERAGDRLGARSLAGELHGLLSTLRPSNPALGRDLVEALSRNGIDDPRLAAELNAETAPRPRGRARAARVTALLYTEDGAGLALPLHLELSPGVGLIWSPSRVADETRRAAELAAVLGLEEEQRRWDLRWQVLEIGTSDMEIRGTSIALPLAVAARAALLCRPVPPGWAFTGDLDLRGDVLAVGSLPGKLRAAAAAGCRHVAVPAVSAAGLEVPAGVELVPTLGLHALTSRLFPRRQLPARWGLGLAGLAALVCVGMLGWSLMSAPPAPGPALLLSFDADGAPTDRAHTYAATERFGVWVQAPGEGALAVLLRRADGLAELLFPRPGEPARWPGGVPLLVPTDANLGDGHALGAGPGEHTLIVLWTPGALADRSTLRELAERAPRDPSAWSAAFPGQPEPSLPQPADLEAATELAGATGTPLVGLVPLERGDPGAPREEVAP